jgi:acetylglutamate kinase
MTIDPVNLAKAETLTEALPYLQRYAGKTFVVKYGGHAMGDASLARDFADDADTESRTRKWLTPNNFFWKS